MKSKGRKQMDLNKKLIEACLQDDVNFEEVKLLLKQGADPIGYYNENGLNVLRQIIGVRGTFDKEDNTTVYDLIKLFLDYGMNINLYMPMLDKKSRITSPFDGLIRMSPEKQIKVLSLLLNEQTEASLLDNYILDICAKMRECKTNDVARFAKVIIYLSSFENLLKHNTKLHEILKIDFTDYELDSFRNPDDFDITVKRNKKDNKLIIEISDKDND